MLPFYWFINFIPLTRYSSIGPRWNIFTTYRRHWICVIWILHFTIRIKKIWGVQLWFHLHISESQCGLLDLLKWKHICSMRWTTDRRQRHKINLPMCIAVKNIVIIVLYFYMIWSCLFEFVKPSSRLLY